MGTELKSDAKMTRDLKNFVEAKRGCKVIRVSRLSKATMNYVFRIDTDRDSIIARVFRKKNFPDCKKLAWVDAALHENKIKTPRIIFCTNDSKPFRFGLMLTDYVEGQDGWSAMKGGDVSLPEYFIKLGKLLKRIHSIQLGNTGELRISSFKSDFEWFDQALAGFKRKISFSDNTYLQIEQLVKSTLSHFSPRFQSVLCHCDLGPYNTIYTKDGKIIPIDWDLSESGSLFRDLSPVTLGVEEMEYFGERSMTIREIQKSVLRGYGETGFTAAETQLILDAHHLISLIYNALACKNTEKDKMQLIAVRKEISLILSTHPDG